MTLTTPVMIIGLIFLAFISLVGMVVFGQAFKRTESMRHILACILAALGFVSSFGAVVHNLDAERILKPEDSITKTVRTMRYALERASTE